MPALRASKNGQKSRCPTVILRELRLWCCRVWDKNGYSLPNVSKRIKSHCDAIVSARRAAHPEWPEHLLQAESLPERIQSFVDRVGVIKNRPILIELKIHRDEHFAHLLRGVSGTRRVNPVSEEREGYTYNEILGLADESVELISEAIFIWRFHSHNDDERRKVLRQHYERYWSLLPVFSELEERQS